MIYLNKKGKQVRVEIRCHAVTQYRKRAKALYGIDMTNQQAADAIRKRFPGMDRKLGNFNRHEKKRLKKYEQTIFFKDEEFTFVVQDAKLLTVEIGRKGERGLN